VSKPENFSTYKKDQVILTSGRLVFNADEDSIFLLSKKDLAISTVGNVHINVGKAGYKESLFIINSNRIQFGLDSKGKVEPVAKADSLVQSLESLSRYLSKFTTDLSQIVGTVESAAFLKITAISLKLNTDLTAFNRTLNKIKSNTTFST
jgi:hypothetical protein